MLLSIETVHFVHKLNKYTLLIVKYEMLCIGVLIFMFCSRKCVYVLCVCAYAVYFNTVN